MRLGERRLQPGSDENAAGASGFVVAADFRAPDIEVRSVVGGLDGKIRESGREPIVGTGVRRRERVGAEKEGDRQACAEEMASPIAPRRGRDFRPIPSENVGCWIGRSLRQREAELLHAARRRDVDEIRRRICGSRGNRETLRSRVRDALAPATHSQGRRDRRAAGSAGRIGDIGRTASRTCQRHRR